MPHLHESNQTYKKKVTMYKHSPIPTPYILSPTTNPPTNPRDAKVGPLDRKYGHFRSKRCLVKLNFYVDSITITEAEGWHFFSSADCVLVIATELYYDDGVPNKRRKVDVINWPERRTLLFAIRHGSVFRAIRAESGEMCLVCPDVSSLRHRYMWTCHGKN